MAKISEEEERLESNREKKNRWNEVKKERIDLVVCVCVGGHDKTRTTEQKLMKFDPTCSDH